MKKLILILISFFTIKLGKAQPNLVPNPSFEDKFTCLNTTLLLEDYIYNWYGGRGYFNSCISIALGVPSNLIGNQYARTGNAYCGIYTRFKLAPNRQYIQVKLIDTLQSNGKYRVAFYVSLGDTLHANCNSIGAYFSPDSFFVSNDGLIEQIPQIQNSEENDLRSKTDWTLVCDTFIATGIERYLTIGNFYTDSLSIFTPLDSVCSIPGGFGCSAYYYIDDVSVTLIDETGLEEQKHIKFSLYPNPNNGYFSLQYDGTLMSTTILGVTDIYGNQLDQIEIINSTTEYATTRLTSGLYFYTIRQGSEELGRGKFMVID
ncbi:MAG: T9SS type A sorting domain-containing protein [Bacteroidota bacterium]|jgi:hypothetical protein